MMAADAGVGDQEATMFSEAIGGYNAAAAHADRMAQIARQSAASSDASFYDALGAVKVLKAALQRTSDQLLEAQCDLDEVEASNRRLSAIVVRQARELDALKARLASLL